MEDSCRICLGHAPRIHSVHISYRITLNKTVSQVVNECASIQMSEQDSFPKYLCSICYRQLLTVNDFRNLIIRSDIHLKRKLTTFITCCDQTSVNLSDTALAVSTPKEDSQCRNQLNSNASQVKSEHDKYLNIPLEEKSEDNKGHECNRREPTNGTQSEKCGEDGVANVSIGKRYIKKEHIKRNPGREPSKMSTKKRKVHEFVCDICKKVLFGRSNRLEQHIIMAHSDIKNFICETCNKKFKSKQQLVNHTRVHTGEKPYQCGVCQNEFASPQNLFNHKKKHTGKYKSYKCESCEKGYSTPGELETHKRIVHTGEKPFLCEICSRAFSSVRNLGVHIRSVHEKTEKCPKCGLMQSNKRIKQHLQKHQDKEDGIRRYTCDKCGKGFFTPHALKKHLVVHTGERPYSCEVCHKSFSQKSAVDTHMRIHSDVRAFCCEVCAKTFKYKQHLQLHLSKNHRDFDKKKIVNNDSNNT